MEDKQYSKEHFKIIGKDLLSFAGSFGMAVIIGLGVGIYASLFGLLINWATGFRQMHPWLLFLLPVGGLAIVGIYKLRKVHDRGTNRVLEAIYSGDPVPLDMTPLITISTAITHFLGGSAGREGAAIQIGGSLGTWFGQVLKLDTRRVTITTLCGMSAAFSALFGTPLTAAIFALEVITIGIMHYSALVPCAVSALVALWVSKWVGLTGMSFGPVSFPDFGIVIGAETLLLAIACAVLGILFCIVLHKSEQLFTKLFKNPYLRTVVGGLVIIGLTLLVGTRDYNGLGTDVIVRAVEGSAVPYAFVAKMIFTGITIGAFYKGGEIVPTIFIGATFGCVFGPLIGIPASVGAALGICGMFCAVTNCPITSIIMCFELFGAAGIPFYLIVAAVSYRLSGYYGLYTGQKIVYSKSLPKLVNRITHE